MSSCVKEERNCAKRPPENAGNGSGISGILRKVTNPPRRYASSQTYSPAPLLCNRLRNSSEKPRWTDGNTARHRSDMHIMARPVGKGAIRRSRMLCIVGTRSSAESRCVGSTPRVENANAFSWTALRSFSANTITIAIPRESWGIGPSTSNNSAWELSACVPMSTAQKASDMASSLNASEFLRWA